MRQKKNMLGSKERGTSEESGEGGSRQGKGKGEVFLQASLSQSWPSFESWCAFLESPENFWVLKSHLYRHEPIIVQGCYFNTCLR